eukprot:Opistho-2@54242
MTANVEFFIVNPTLLLQDMRETAPFLLSSDNSRPLVLVDASTGSPSRAPSLIKRDVHANHPSLMTLTAAWSLIESALEDASLDAKDGKTATATALDIIDLKSDNCWCMTSVAGWMLGYPAVYWTPAEATGNSLGGVALVVHRAEVTFPGRPLMPLCSFSVPECLSACPEVLCAVEGWSLLLSKRAFTELSRHSSLSFVISLTSSVVNMDMVAM